MKLTDELARMRRVIENDERKFSSYSSDYFERKRFVDGQRDMLDKLDALAASLELARDWPAEGTLTVPIAGDIAFGAREFTHDFQIHTPQKVVGVVCDSTRFAIDVRVGVENCLVDYRPTTPNLPRPVKDAPWAPPGFIIMVRLRNVLERCSDHDECRISRPPYDDQAAMCTLRPKVSLFVENLPENCNTWGDVAKSTSRNFHSKLRR